jgi:hypothetical protein
VLTRRPRARHHAITEYLKERIDGAKQCGRLAIRDGLSGDALRQCPGEKRAVIFADAVTTSAARQYRRPENFESAGERLIGYGTSVDDGSEALRHLVRPADDRAAAHRARPFESCRRLQTDIRRWSTTA